eukprot:CAMPEP_0115083972 /NCGR_PEP_ID=MMETSP0227-20121206/20945_1 /TAXON_ID=89957 /ORGANISM="Polarella glacialis, Strain CCMP 1383" /LENGTH=520 /DNA_ID=CAMNT_0002472615 /DNA_START=147 /DNA_END=1706 /DNA_ORIENTATION=-
MGLARSARAKRAPPALKRKINFLTSFGVGACLVLTIVSLELHRHVYSSTEEVGPALSEERQLQERRLDLYPRDLLINKPYADDPKRWLVFLHVIGIGYMLLGLNTVCDVYFTGALENMVNTWHIKADVAGATFMAAGGSAPELFTSLIGTCIAENDVGFGTIVGSAVFNVLFVIGLCGYVAPYEIKLTWWPLFRDCSFYIVSLCFLAGFAHRERIELHEAIILFILYLIYITIMYFNPRLEELAYSRERKMALLDSEGVTEVKPSPTSMGCTTEDMKPSPSMKDNFVEPEPEEKALEAGEINDGEDDGEKKEDGGDDDDDEDFMARPDGGAALVMWIMSMPVYVPLNYSMPRPSPKWFMATFFISLMWIAAFAFLLVWWTEILGNVLRIPTIIMGLTFLAAGTSIPDAVSSMAVARKGEGDMAVSSSIGSNIFDILVGLPIPWIIKIAFIEGGNYAVKIQSPFLVFYVVVLLIMVFAVVISIHFLGWVLNKKLGIIMAVLYVIFIILVVSVESNTESFMW